MPRRSTPCSRLPQRTLLARLAGALAVLACGLGPAGEASAQTGVWRQIALPGAGANAVAGGDSGTVLAVSTAGLFRYDGLRVRRLPIFSTRTDSLDGTTVLQARNGDIWFGTSNQGLFRLRPDGVVDRYTAASGIGNSANDEILDLAEAPNGDIWAGTNLGGLSRFNGVAWTSLTTDQGLPSMTVRTLAIDPRDGSLWAGTIATGTAAGLVHVVGGAVAAVYDQFTVAFTRNVQSVVVTSGGEVWIGNDAAVARLVGSAFEETSAGGTPTSLVEGAHGELWFGTNSRGVGVFDLGGLRLLPGGPPSNTVRDLYRDAAGVLWVATTGGLARFEGAAWRSHRESDGLPPFVGAFAAGRDFSAVARGDSIDPHGIVWIGTEPAPLSPTQTAKLVRRANGRVRFLGTEQGLPLGLVSAIAVSDSGAIWCGTATASNGGAARVRVDGSVARVVDKNQGLPSGYVLGLADAGNGAVWVATAAGAAFIDANGFRLLRAGPGFLPDAALVGVAADARGRAWFASGQNPFAPDARTPTGAVRFDPADSSYFAVGVAEGLPSGDLNGVAVATDGDVWFASDLGVARYRAGVVRTFTVNDGLPTNQVLRLVAAPDGRVWAATNEGIAVFDGARWSAYNVADGLIGNIVADLYADSLGVIASCKREGVSLFHPDGTPPRVEIVSGPPPASGSNTAQFAVRGGDLDSDASRVRISSELEGRAATPFEEDVSAITLNLMDGSYVFRVRARDRALNETIAAAEWRFTIDATPPRPIVQQPAFNDVVADTVHVLGTVNDPRLAAYAVELRAAGTVPWDTLFTSPSAPAPGASLYDWDSRSVNDGVWELRIGALDSLGLIGYAQVSIIVDNFAPGAGVTAPALVDHVTGGHVFTTNGEVELYVPPNAFAANQIVRIDPLPPLNPAGPLAGRVRVGWILRDPALVLARPATLSIGVPGGADAGLAIARLVVADGDTTLVAVGGAVSADGTRLTTTISTFGSYVVASGTAGEQAFAGARGLDCQPRVFSPRGGGFDVRTAISFELGKAGQGAIKIYDRAGRLVRELAESADFAPGTNVVYWDGADGGGEIVPSGLYTIAARFDGKTVVRTVAVANR